MEMHQVRYFLAVARTLNFTRAAEECNVAQPSLTRAIKLLEGELGGDLFRRERPQAMLTPLGERIYPLLKQCYDSAMSARSLATMINDGEVGVLKIAVSSSVELSLIMSPVTELKKHLSDLELKIMRAPGVQVTEFLKSGDAELAIAAAIGDPWDRLDRWPLFEESFDLAFSRGHRLANHEAIKVEDLKPERFLVRSHCESRDPANELLQKHGINADRRHEVASDQDLVALLEANIGIGFMPRSATAPPSLVRTAIDGLELRRKVFLYGVAGRQRTPVAATFMKMLRAADWPSKP